MDGVGIVAILQKSTGPELLLQKQFRPPINKVTIEVPAGLVDEGETAAESAVRELREETGYHGVAAEVSPIMFNGKAALTVSKEIQKARSHSLVEWGLIAFCIQRSMSTSLLQITLIYTSKPRSWLL